MTDLLAWAADHPEATVALAVLLLTLVERAIRRAAPRAADVVAAAIPHVPSIVEAIKGKGPSSMRPPPDDKPKAPPGVASMCFLAIMTASCGSSDAVRKVESVAHAARDVAVIAESCSFAAKEQAMAKCSTDDCRASVLRTYKPVADALDAFHAAWCALSPDSEGCR